MFSKYYNKLFALYFLVFCLRHDCIYAEKEQDIMVRLAHVMTKIQLIDDKVQALVDDGDAQTLLDKMDLKLDTVNANLDMLLQQKTGKTNIINNHIPDEDINNLPDEDISVSGNIISGDGTQKDANHEKNVIVPAIDAKQEPIRFYSAVRNRTSEEENTFTITLKTKSNNMLYRVYDDLGFLIMPDVIEDGDLCSIIFKLRNTSNPEMDPWFTATDMGYYQLIALQLGNSFDEAVTSYEFGDLPEIDLAPYRKEAVYEYGENLEIEVEVNRPNYSSMATYTDGVSDYFFGVDLKTLKTHSGGGNYEWFKKSEDFRFNNGIYPPSIRPTSYSPTKDRVKQTVDIMTSNHPLSGYYSLSYQIHLNEMELVKQMQISKYIILRPSNQSGPFPPAYLSMVDLREAENGNEKWSCRVGVECPIECQAVGENVTSLDVVQILPGGELAEVPSLENSLVDVVNSKAVWWVFKSERNSGDVNGITTFRCQANDHVHGRSVHKLIDVEAFIENRIVKEKSGLRIRNSQVYDIVEVTFSCYVEGRPLPNVTFSSGSTHISDIGDDETVAVPVITDDHIGGYATKEVLMHRKELTRVMENIRAGTKGRLPYCSVPHRDYSPGDTFEFDFSKLSK